MSPTSSSTERGFSLVEMLVALAIGLVLTLAITTMLVQSEEGKRNLHSGNDMDQEATFTAYTLDRLLRNAGSGMTQQKQTLYGCTLAAAKGGTQILPMATALTDPAFATMPLSVNVAPVVIFQNVAGNNGGDVLQVMSGAGGVSEAALPITLTSVTNTSLRLPNTLGLRNNELVMLFDPAIGCMVQQVYSTGWAGSADPLLPLSGAYYGTAFGGKTLLSYAAARAPVLLHIGNVAEQRNPQFTWIGVGANRTLEAYDLLQTASTSLPQAAQPLAEGVMEMHAVYGVDTNTTNPTVVNAYRTPTGSFAATTLLNGTAASLANLNSILSIRVAVVLSAPLVEKNAVAGPSTLTMFSDLGSAYTVTTTFTGDELKRRHRVVDFTVPLRTLLN